MTFPDPVANALCLELVNSVNDWHRPTADALADSDSAASWAKLVGAPLASAPDEQALARARALRATVHQVFLAIARDQAAPDAALTSLQDAYAAGVQTARLTPAGSTYDFAWPEPGSLQDLLARAAASAVELLTDGPLDRVGECPSCGWLFLDTSRNGRRRWCSMDSCGARVKARRHYAARTGSAD